MAAEYAVSPAIATATGYETRYPPVESEKMARPAL